MFQKKRIWQASFLWMIVTLTVGSSCFAAGERLPVWRISTTAADVVLLGSVHMAYPDIYPLRNEIKMAFEAADTLVVEVDIGGGNALEIQQMIMQKGMFPSGETLQQHLSPNTWKNLTRYLEDRGLSVEMFSAVRPGLLVMTLSSMRMMDIGMRPELGIDTHFLDQARGTKTIIELETAEQQIDLLLGFSHHDLLVTKTLVQLDEIEKTMTPLYSAWKNGDANKLNQLILLDDQLRNPQFKPIYDRIFTQRNIDMAKNISTLIETPGRYFVVVGAGHLVGSEGIISLLKNKGYEAQRL